MFQSFKCKRRYIGLWNRISSLAMLTHCTVSVNIYSSADNNNIDSNNNKCNIICVTKPNIDAVTVYA